MLSISWCTLLTKNILAESMRSTWLRVKICLQQILDLRKVFTFLCAVLTLLLIFQELFAFAITRPTSNFQEEKDLQTGDIPEVVLCFEPGFDFSKLERYGYNSDTYYRGSMDGKSFVGWNGDETKSSKDILEEILVVDNEVNSFIWVWFTEDRVDLLPPGEVKMRTLTYPYGRCVSIRSPPSPKNMNTLKVGFNKTAFSVSKITSDRVRVFFMDTANSLRLYPNYVEMTGDPIEISLKDPSSAILFKTKVTQSVHVQGDPLFHCTAYTADNSYNDCVQDELLDPIEKEIGCQPPLLAKDEKLICNRRFNVSTGESRKMARLFKPLYYHDTKFNCRTPCMTNVYTTKRVQTTPSKIENNTYMILVFGKTLEVSHSSFSIDGQTLLTRLGGSVSSGRTLLWILVSLLGAGQVKPCQRS